MGARPLRREIESTSESGLTKGLLSGKIFKGTNLLCYYNEKTESLKFVKIHKEAEKNITRQAYKEFIKKRDETSRSHEVSV